jgi:lysophospholipase L1-like esterase
VKLRFLAMVAAASVGVTSCGVLDALTGNDGYVDGVGRIPGGDFNSLITLPEGVSVNFPELLGEMIGPQVEGSRVLLVGDSIFASTSRRYGNEMCDTLTKLGWQVAVEAEAGRFIDFGQKVLRSRQGEGWDAIVVFLGTNYDGNEMNYETRLRDIVEIVWPTPIVLLTTAMFRETQREVNDIVRQVKDEYDNVTVLDWEKIATTPGVISQDRVHLTADGRAVLATAVARALEFAPDRNNGKCLDSRFTDDSEVLDDDEIIPVETTVPAEAVVDTTVVTSEPETTTSVP